MININNKVDCCGCNVCGDICTHNAISFTADDEGFLYPKVEMELCTDCHLCEKVCPMLHVDQVKRNDFETPYCYAAQNKNLEALFDSTSGSAFSALAEKMYKLGGYVGGAIFNDDYSVSQFISCEKNDLKKLRNSKYIQSDSHGFYKQVRELLKNGEKVLVCGLPCQIAGLKSYLQKNYENLISIDLICLGVNSPLFLKGYLNYMEEKHNSKIIYYKAKNKELGWRKLTTKIVFENGDVEYDKSDTNYFTHGFIGTHAFSRPSCYNCRFKGFPRIADISLGDLWGAERIVGKDFDHDMGTSVIMINSKKGADFFESAQAAFMVTQVDIKDVIRGNSALISPLKGPEFDRKIFYEDFNQMKFIDFAKKYIVRPVDKPVGIKRGLINTARFCYHLIRVSGLNPRMWWLNLYYNLLSSQCKTNIYKGKFIIFEKHSTVNINRGAKIIVEGILDFGQKRIKGSSLESRLLVEKGATLITKGGSIAYGADIEVFAGSTLELGGGIAFNINSTIICGSNIKIGDDVCFGRDVTVRDNNGGHFMSRRMFKDKRSVIIGQHSWICEHSIVMPGAKIGVGVVVGAGSFVTGKLPNFVLAKGNPAIVVDEDVYWKA